MKCNYKRIIIVYGGAVYLGDSTYSVAGVVKALIGLAIVRAQQLRISTTPKQTPC